MSGSKSVRPVSSILVSAFLLGILATASLAQNASPQTAPNNAPLTPLPQAPAPEAAESAARCWARFAAMRSGPNLRWQVSPAEMQIPRLRSEEHTSELQSLRH